MKLEKFFANLLTLISYNENDKIVAQSQKLISDLNSEIDNSCTENEAFLYKQQIHYLQSIQNAALEKLNCN